MRERVIGGGNAVFLARVSRLMMNGRLLREGSVYLEIQDVMVRSGQLDRRKYPHGQGVFSAIKLRLFLYLAWW